MTEALKSLDETHVPRIGQILPQGRPEQHLSLIHISRLRARRRRDRPGSEPTGAIARRQRDAFQRQGRHGQARFLVRADLAGRHQGRRQGTRLLGERHAALVGRRRPAWLPGGQRRPAGRGEDSRHGAGKSASTRRRRGTRQPLWPRRPRTADRHRKPVGQTLRDARRNGRAEGIASGDADLLSARRRRHGAPLRTCLLYTSRCV